jgi:hypothetical protein
MSAWPWCWLTAACAQVCVPPSHDAMAPVMAPALPPPAFCAVFDTRVTFLNAGGFTSMYAPPEQLLNQPCGPPAGLCTAVIACALQGFLLCQHALRGKNNLPRAARLLAGFPELSTLTACLLLHMLACLPARRHLCPGLAAAGDCERGADQAPRGGDTP